MTELRIKLQKKQKLFAESIEKFDIVGYGGARGGGKSVGLRYIHLLRRSQYPKSVGVIFRATYPELEANHIRPLFAEFPSLKEYWNESKKTLTLPNGSVQLFRHCGTIKDAPLYQGLEYHDFAYEEAGDLDEELFETLKGSNRSGLSGIPAKCQLTFNPGGKGHKWLKRRFIDKNLKPHEALETYYFVPALLQDNDALTESDPNYRRRLESMGSETLKRAWLDGDWNIEAGQYFSDLRPNIHFIEPFKIPEHWKLWCGYDYGWSHPASFVWFAVDEDGNVYVYREWSESRKSIEEQGKIFNSFPEATRISVVEAGHDCWVDKGSAFARENNPTTPTIAEAFAKQRIYLKPAHIDRKLGWSFIREQMRYETKTTEDGKIEFTRKPKVFIFNTCPLLWDCLNRMVHNPDNTEDVLKEDAKEGDPTTGDDLGDAFRYGLMNRYSASQSVENPRKKYSLMRRYPARPSWRTV